jgi:hypothetical protein
MTVIVLSPSWVVVAVAAVSVLPLTSMSTPFAGCDGVSGVEGALSLSEPPLEGLYGVAALEVAEAGPVPAAFEAVTVKV